MRLLIDTDAFCKLGVADLLDAALAAIGVDLSDCARLAALPHMLRRGKLVRLYGAERCSALLRRAEEIDVIPEASPEWLEPLAESRDIDPGEAQLFAVAAQKKLSVLTNDKRALRAVARVEAVRAALDGRIVSLEAMLSRLCDAMDLAQLRTALASLEHDQLVRICFSSGSPDPREALRSYLDSLQEEVSPLMLWGPAEGRIT